jgi:acetyl-CoA carboxylase carboxyl transferase subunit beta
MPLAQTQSPRNFRNWLHGAGKKIAALFPRRVTITCPDCAFDLRRAPQYRALRVCDRCGHHFPMAAYKRLETLADARSFDETHRRLAVASPRALSADETYAARLRQARRESHLREAVITGSGKMDGVAAMFIVLDFSFLGGSMGANAGEKIARAFEEAREQKLPLIAITTSGGARIQEGMLALMQMAKTAAAAQRFHAAHLLFITILAHPTTGGVYASFANLADVILAEPRALIGFAGPRVVEALTRAKLPPESHHAEFLLAHGMIDAIVPRPELRATLGRLLKLLAAPAPLPPLPQRRRERGKGEGGWGEGGEGKSAWEVVTLARRADRPTALDYLRRVFGDFVELHGDRFYGDDPAIVGGLAKLDKHTVVVIGQERGHAAETETRHHGSAEPEGYRKATRLMRLAAKFDLPIITFVDTPGADPSYEAEKRGVAMAIAHALGTLVQTPVPTIAVVIGEGGSGGALALAAADRVLMLENAIYSVISPEGASAILFGDATHAVEAADKLRLTARDLKHLGIVDEIIAEPSGGAHLDPDAAAQNVRAHLLHELAALLTQPRAERGEARYQKYRAMGQGVE